MNIVALGTSGTYARYNRACSGYLIEQDPTFVMVDIGTGTLSNLFRHLDPMSLSALVITHLHADHVLDIYPMRYYIQYNLTEEQLKDSKIPIYVPEDGRQELHSFNPGNDDSFFLENTFEFNDIEEKIEIGSLRFEFIKTKHLITTYGLTCESNGKKMGYTSDTPYDENLIDFFSGCQVLICEAAYQTEKGKENLHMSAREAGKFAAEVGTKRLYLTHIWPELDPHVSITEASKYFDGQIEAIKEHMVVEV